MVMEGLAAAIGRVKSAQSRHRCAPISGVAASALPVGLRIEVEAA